jgi:hypothetical protein
LIRELVEGGFFCHKSKPKWKVRTKLLKDSFFGRVFAARARAFLNESYGMAMYENEIFCKEPSMTAGVKEDEVARKKACETEGIIFRWWRWDYGEGLETSFCGGRYCGTFEHWLAAAMKTSGKFLREIRLSSCPRDQIANIGSQN